MSADAPSQSIPPFHLSHYQSEEPDHMTGSRLSQFSRTLSSDDGHATVNLPHSNASTSNHYGPGNGPSSMGPNGMHATSNNSANNDAMSNSISSLHSNTSHASSGGHVPPPTRTGYDQASRLRQTFNNARSSSPLSRPPLFSPNLLHEVERSSPQVRSPSGTHPASSPPPRSNVTSPRYFTEPHHSANAPSHLQHSVQHHQQHSHLQHQSPSYHPSQHTQQQAPQQSSSRTHSFVPSTQHAPSFQHGHMQQPWQSRSGGMGPLDFAPSAQPPALSPSDRPHSSMSERASRIHDGAARSMGPGTSQSPVGGINKESEFSIFVGDLSPDLREDDLVAQFLQPPAWPHNHPFAAALIHAQQAQGIYQPDARIGPAPFASAKSAKIMTDPITGVSKGYGFVRFSLEADCNRALVEMQGVVVSPANGLSPGRPLRVSTATPKNRGTAPPSLQQPLGPNMAGDPNQQPLQMPRPHNPAQNAGPSFLYNGASSGGPAIRSEVVSPQPHVRQQSSPTTHQASLVSPISPASPYDGPGGPSSGNGPASFGPLYGGFPGNGGDGTRDSSPAGMMRSHTPSSAPPMMQQGGGGPSGNPGDSAADPNNTTVFVGGLSSLISEATLRRYFEHFGEITYVKIPPGKGCGFVQYVRKQDAENAIQRMNGFPILNSKIRLSWGRSQGDKAAAAAAQTMAQYAQLGQLAGLAGLSTLSPSQLAQLAGLGSVLSAAQAQMQGQAQGPSQRGPPGFGLGGAGGLANDPLSTLARQLAATNGVGGGMGPGGHANHSGPGMGQRAPLPSFLQNQQQSHQGQQPSHLHQHQHQQQQQPFRGQHGFPSSQNLGLPGIGANGAFDGAPGYNGRSGSSHSNQGFDFDPRSASGPDHHFGPQDGNQSRSAPFAPQHHQQGDFSGMPPLSESELVDAFAGLDFDETTRAALAQRLQAMQQQDGGPNRSNADGFGPASGSAAAAKRADSFGSGYNRDPNAFMFSPFSPSDSPIVGGKADLPNSQSNSSSLYLSHRADDDGSSATHDPAAAAGNNTHDR
ncbi:mRNA binding post-transcriptional regulator [Pseudozyma hubeiensis SY62]|uniref:mRNA binding post-transcriptional regulator n=1 Tax=Pseudozyma hubeiensis (strain SY62) TaxID=1305764 RepID=R9P6L0_PSEHS|nr:mRNA binding post-transcriptional regulator [Pseudozyma hubeiensis SY62]GAC96974.1 mRNA binding post-transcriptional regulator [Pseudozyma hubeiensis SY62]